jgi:hypothetical protein
MFRMFIANLRRLNGGVLIGCDMLLKNGFPHKRLSPTLRVKRLIDVVRR